jgi:hypothetical protein
MSPSWLPQLEQWHGFFLLCGTAGGILAGILFVVISLAPTISASDHATSVRACISPNAVHFAAVLVVANSLMAHAVPQALIGWLLCTGAALTLLYLWSVRGRQPWHVGGISVPDAIWYLALPYAAYTLALAGGTGILRDDERALPLIAAVLILLLVIGIRNAWDLAVWLPAQEVEANSHSPTPAAPGDE